MDNYWLKKQKEFDISEHEDRIDKLISKIFNHSFMSNSKWKKLFTALDNEDIVLNQINLKLVDRDIPFLSYMPKSEDLEEFWISEGTNSYNYFYKEIEWLELTWVGKIEGYKSIPFKHYHQDIEKAIELVKTIGSFRYELLSTGLRIYGYE
ncbi:DUF6678 family protein [Leptospira sp. GIMC2001]|uniref:DUF6678 family protein n=1 Tax=Leptospira sp. GIMC2001 TaxID=1513297 RepID=UPI002348F39C|nr:DUF6678 family protein [Leptospira sp. GIMC2001]WCL51043.1 hypothetical protein O4O04_09585 [Leptospira sp. GIMC2001]